MLYFIFGLLLSFVLNFIPLWQPSKSTELLPEWTCPLSSIENIESSPVIKTKQIRLNPVVTDNGVFILNGAGSLLSGLYYTDLVSVSGNGMYVLRYQKTGTAIEMTNMNEDRFWKIDSREYPHVSYNAKLILLLNGDMSRARLFDENGNKHPVEISGRLCTSIAFSKGTDFAALGFMDGSYYVLGSKGGILYKDSVPSGNMVKTIAVSSNGSFVAVHYGNTGSDKVRIADVESKKHHTLNLADNHIAKTAMHIAEDTFVIIDNNRILFTDLDADIENIVNITPKKPGTASIESSNDIYAVTYTDINGQSRFILFNDERVQIYGINLPDEQYLECSIKDFIILLRGSNNLYCYSYN